MREVPWRSLRLRGSCGSTRRPEETASLEPAEETDEDSLSQAMAGDQIRPPRPPLLENSWSCCWRSFSLRVQRSNGVSAVVSAAKKRQI